MRISALCIAMVMFCLACAATKPAVSLPIEAASLPTESKEAEEAEATWGDKMSSTYRTYRACVEYNSCRSHDTCEACKDIHLLRTQVASIVSPMLGEWDKVYEESRVDVGSRIDNLVFVEIHLGCPPGFFSEYFGCARSVSRVAVILGEKPRIVELPDEALFVHFMKNIRKTPRALELSTKMRTTLMLLTGDSNFVASSINDPNQMPCPDELLTRGCRDEFILENTTWTDKDGVLVIQYRTSDSWWDYECRLRVDAEQRAMRRCVSINREPECFVEHFFVPDKKTRRGCDNEADMPVELWVDESKRGFVHSVLPESYHF